MGKYMSQHLVAVDYESSSELAKEVFNAIGAYKTMEILSEGEQKNLKYELMIHKEADGVETIIGENYKFNVFENSFHMIVKFKVTGYDLIKQYKESLFALGITSVNDKTKSLGMNNFEVMFVIKFDQMDLEVLMPLFSLFNVK